MTASTYITAAISLVALLAAPCPVRADETIDLPTFLERVRSAGPDARASAALVDVAASRTASAALRPAPGLEVGLAQLDISGQGAPTSSLVGVGIPIEVGGDRRARIDEAQAGRAYAASGQEAALAELSLAAALAFVDAVEAAELTEVTRASLVSLEALAVLDERRLAAGEVTELESLRVLVERDRLQAALLHAEGHALAMREALRRYLGDDAPAVVPVLAQRADEGELDESVWLARAYESRRELAAVRDRVALAEATRSRVRAARIPDLLLRIGWTHNGSTAVDQFRQHANDTLAVILNMPMPFGNRRRADLGEASAVIDEADAAMAVTRARIAAEVRAAYAEHRGAHEQQVAFDGGISERAARLRDRSEHAYARDGLTLLELLTARRAADEIDAARVAARADHARARLRLEAASAGVVAGF